MSSEMDLIAQGFVLMVVGMSSVFVLLTLIVSLLNASAKFFERWPLDEDPGTKTVNSSDDEELEMIAVALAAAERGGE